MDFSKTPETIFVSAQLHLKKTEEGGRLTGIKSRYRPNHVFEYKGNEILNTYMGEICFDDSSLIMPGEDRIVSIEFLFHPSIEKYLNIGQQWRIHEGERMVGEAEIIEVKT